MTTDQWIAAHRRRQGLPSTITAPDVLARLAALIHRRQGGQA